MMPTTEPLQANPPAGLAALSLDNSRLFVAAVVLSIVPFWFGSYLPMVDLPGQSAVIAALQLSAGNPMFVELFDADWFTPYLFGYLVIYAIAISLPITITMKLVVSASVAAVPLLTAAPLTRSRRGLALAVARDPLEKEFAFYWGFYSYLVAVPFALLAARLPRCAFERRTTVGNALGIAGLAVFLFFAHVIVMGVACLCALLYLGGCHYRNVRKLVTLYVPYTAPLPLIAAWMIPRVANEEGVADAPVVFGPWGDRLAYLFAQPGGYEYLSTGWRLP